MACWRASPRSLRPRSATAVLANLRALLAASLQVAGGRFVTPYAFVRALKAGGVMAPASHADDAVRLLTIHGAKGLEAHAVVLLDTDTAPSAADTMGVLVDWPAEAAQPDAFFFVSSEARPPVCAQATLDTERGQRQREELNALYVAMTRARDTLVVSSIEPHRAAPGSWWQRLVGCAAPQVVASPALCRYLVAVAAALPQIRAPDAARSCRCLRPRFAVAQIGEREGTADDLRCGPDRQGHAPSAGMGQHRRAATQAVRREFALDAGAGAARCATWRAAS